MDKECQIKDDDEILEEEKNRFNFRRFTQDEIIKKNNVSPFERTKKKDVTFPFLFQKKKPVLKNEKVSLDEILEKVKDLSFNSPFLYSPKTPPYSPWDISENTIPHLDLSNNIVTNLNDTQPMELDEQK
jgi:hypothetical protein